MKRLRTPTAAERIQLRLLLDDILAARSLDAFAIASQTCEAYMRKQGLWKGRENYGKGVRFRTYWAKRRVQQRKGVKA